MASENDFFIAFNSNIEAEARNVIENLELLDSRLTAFENRTRQFDIKFNIDERDIELINRLNATGDINVKFDGQDLRQTLANALASSAKEFGKAVAASVRQSLSQANLTVQSTTQAKPKQAGSETVIPSRLSEQLSLFGSGLESATSALGSFMDGLTAVRSSLTSLPEASVAAASKPAAQQQDPTTENATRIVNNFAAAVKNAFQELEVLRRVSQTPRGVREEDGNTIVGRTVIADEDLARLVRENADDGVFDEESFARVVAERLKATLTTLVQTEPEQDARQAIEAAVGALRNVLPSLISDLRSFGNQTGDADFAIYDLPVDTILREFQSLLSSIEISPLVDAARQGEAAAKAAAEGDKEVAAAADQAAKSTEKLSRESAEAAREIEKTKSALGSIGTELRNLFSESRVGDELRRAFLEGRGGPHSTRASNEDILAALLSRTSSRGQAPGPDQVQDANRAPRSVVEEEDPLIMGLLRRQLAEQRNRPVSEVTDEEVRHQQQLDKNFKLTQANEKLLVQMRAVLTGMGTNLRAGAEVGLGVDANPILGFRTRSLETIANEQVLNPLISAIRALDPLQGGAVPAGERQAGALAVETAQLLVDQIRQASLEAGRDSTREEGEGFIADPNRQAEALLDGLQGLRFLLKDLTGVDIEGLGRPSKDPKERIAPEVISQLGDVLRTLGARGLDKAAPQGLTGSLQFLSTILGGRHILARNVTIPRDADDPLLRASRDEGIDEVLRLVAIQERQAQAMDRIVSSLVKVPAIADDPALLSSILDREALGLSPSKFEDFLAALISRIKITADVAQSREGVDPGEAREAANAIRAIASTVGEFRSNLVQRNEDERRRDYELSSGISAARGYKSTANELLSFLSPEGETLQRNKLRGLLAERYQGNFNRISRRDAEIAEQAGIGGQGIFEETREFNKVRLDLLNAIEEALADGRQALQVLRGAREAELRKVSSEDDIKAVNKDFDEREAAVRERTRRRTERILRPTKGDIRADPSLEIGDTGLGGLRGLIEQRRRILEREVVLANERVEIAQWVLSKAKKDGSADEIRKAERYLHLKIEEQAQIIQKQNDAIRAREAEDLRKGKGWSVPTSVTPEGIRADATQFLLDAMSSGPPTRPVTFREDTKLGRTVQSTSAISELVAQSLEAQRHVVDAQRKLAEFDARTPQRDLDAPLRDPYIKGELSKETEKRSDLVAALRSAESILERLTGQISTRLGDQDRSESLELLRALRLAITSKSGAFGGIFEGPTGPRDKAQVEDELKRLASIVSTFLTAERRRNLGLAETGNIPESDLTPALLARLERLLQFESGISALRTGDKDVVGGLPAIRSELEASIREAVLALPDDSTAEDIARAMNRELASILERAFLRGQERKFGEEIGTVVKPERIREEDIQVEESQALKQQREAAAAMERAATIMEGDDGSVLQQLTRAIRELVECCKAMRGIARGEGEAPKRSAFGIDEAFANRPFAGVAPEQNSDEVRRFIASLVSAISSSGRYAYKPEQIADLTRSQFGPGAIADDDAFKGQVQSMRRMGEESKRAADAQKRLAREGAQAAQQVESSWHRAQGAINQTFGSGGVIAKAFNFIGLFVAREIAGAMVFGITSAARRIGMEILEIQDQIVRVEQALESLGQNPAGIRTGLAGISSDLAIPMSDLTSTAAALVGVFEDASQVQFATNVVGQLEKISNGALNAKEGFRSIQAIVSAFEIEGAAGLQQVADIATQIQNLTSVNVEDTVEGISNIAEQARSLNLSIQETGVLLALVARGTGSTGDAAAEKLGRLLSGFQDPAKIGLLRNLELQDGTNAIDEQLISAREYGQVLAQLAARWDEISQTQRDQVAAAFGSRREAAVFQAIVGQGNELGELITDVVDTSAGAAQRRVDVLLENLNGQLQRLAIQFTNLIATLSDLGLVTPLTTLLGTLNDILGAVTAIVNTVARAAELFPPLGAGIEIASTAAALLVLGRMLPRIMDSVGEFAGIMRGEHGTSQPLAGGLAVQPPPRAPRRIGNQWHDPVTGDFVSAPPTFDERSRRWRGIHPVTGRRGYVPTPEFADELLERQARERAAQMTRLQRASLRTSGALGAVRTGMGNLRTGLSSMFAAFPGGIAGLAALTAGMALWNKLMDRAADSQNELNTVLQHYGFETREQVNARRDEEAIEKGASILDTVHQDHGLEDRALNVVTRGFQKLTRGRGFFGGAGAIAEAGINEILRIPGHLPGGRDFDPLGVRTDARTNIDTTAQKLADAQNKYNREMVDLANRLRDGDLTPDAFADEAGNLSDELYRQASEILADAKISDDTYKLLSDRMGQFLASGQDYVTEQLAGQAELIAAVQLDPEQVDAINKVRELLSGSTRGFREEYADDIRNAIEATGLDEDSTILKHLNAMNEAGGAVARARSALQTAIDTRTGILASRENFQGEEGETWEDALLAASQDVEASLQNLIDTIITMSNLHADIGERFGNYESAAANLARAEGALKSRLSRLEQDTPEFFETYTQLLDTQARIADLAIQGTQDTLSIYQALTDNEVEGAGAALLAAQQRFDTAIENAGAFSQEEITSRFIEVIEANTAMIEAQVVSGDLTEVEAKVKQATYKRDQLVQLIKTASAQQQQAFAEAIDAGLPLYQALFDSGIEIAPGDPTAQIESQLGSLNSIGQSTVDILGRINAALRGTLNVRFPGGLINLVLGQTPRSTDTSYAGAQTTGPSGFDNVVADQSRRPPIGPDDVNALSRQAIEAAEAQANAVAAMDQIDFGSPQFDTNNFMSQDNSAAEDAAREAEEKAEQLRQAIAATETARLRDPVLRAQRELTEAIRRVAYTRGRDAIEHQQALQQEIQARQALADAIQAQTQAQYALDEAIASAAGDVIRVAELQLEAAQDALRHAQEQFGRGSTEWLNARAAEINAQANLRDSELNFEIEELEFQRDMGEITTQAYIDGLESILATHDLTLAQARDIQRKLKAARESVNSALAPGFNIPDEINIPTPYQVRASLGLPNSRRQQSLSSANSMVNNSGWNFNTSIQNNITQVMTEGQMRELMAQIERNVAQAVDRGVRSGSGGLVPLS